MSKYLIPKKEEKTSQNHDGIKGASDKVSRREASVPDNSNASDGISPNIINNTLSDKKHKKQKIPTPGNAMSIEFILEESNRNLLDKVIKYVNTLISAFRREIETEIKATRIEVNAESATELLIEKIIAFTKDKRNADYQYIHTVLTCWGNNYNYLRIKLKTLIQLLFEMKKLSV